jgi:PPM family protein phosphatase
LISHHKICYREIMRSRPQKKKKTGSRGSYRKGWVSAWAVTDVGLKRQCNEDSFLVDSDLQLYIVADGMGGHAGGGTASRMAVETVRKKVVQARRSKAAFNRQASERESGEIMKLLDDSIRLASEKIYQASSDKPELSGMGTTLTLMLVHGARGYVAHVGDSRLYRWRDGQFSQITEDHSLVNEQIKAGFITHEEAQVSRFRNIITRSVGFESNVTVDVQSFPLQPGNVFLLCSDGLSGMVDGAKMEQVMAGGRLSDAPGRFVELAKEAGGEDNITLVLIRYNGDFAKEKKTQKKVFKKG